MVLAVLVDAPETKPSRHDPNDAAHPIGLGLQLSMAQNPTDVFGCPIRLDIKVNQAISLMTQATIIEIAVEREECGPVQLMQQSNHLGVLHALPSKVLANPPKIETPAPQQRSLILGDVFIQNVHAGSDS
jgi:hypothetical protein